MHWVENTFHNNENPANKQLQYYLDICTPLPILEQKEVTRLGAMWELNTAALYRGRAAMTAVRAIPAHCECGEGLLLQG